MLQYVTGAAIRKQYQVSTTTLHRWSNEDETQEEKIHCIRTPGGTRLYRAADVQKLLGKKNTVEKTRRKIAYARVSSAHQKEDLSRQIQAIRKEHSDIQENDIIQDIGSGTNLHRPGLTKLFEQIHENNVSTVILLFKDRLCRFGFELIEWLAHKHETKIMVLNSQDRDSQNVTQELSEDLLAVVNFFVAKNNGLRAGINRRKRKLGVQGAENPIISQPNTKKHLASLVRNGEMDLEPNGSFHPIERSGKSD